MRKQLDLNFKVRTCNMYPSVFVNHGGGPLPLMGRDPALVEHMQGVRKLLPKHPPKAIVVFSAHWESSPVKVTANEAPDMLYDYYGFPPETYEYQYPAPGNPGLAAKIQGLLQAKSISCELDERRGFDHGVFIPLMLMYPEADVPVVAVSLDSSLSADKNMQIGEALSELRNEDVLIVGSGYTFHNMKAFFNPSEETYKASTDFNEWLKGTLLKDSDNENVLQSLKEWDRAPGARTAHPREEHLLPLFMTAATSSPGSKPTLIYDAKAGNGQHAVSSYLFN